jgi:hypothetical protein
MVSLSLKLARVNILDNTEMDEKAPERPFERFLLLDYGMRMPVLGLLRQFYLIGK